MPGGRPDDFAQAADIASLPAPQQQLVGGRIVPMVINGIYPQPNEAPALAAQTNAQIVFLVAVQVAVGKIAGLFDGSFTIEPAHVQAVDRAGLHVAGGSFHAGLVLHAFRIHFDDDAADAAHFRVAIHVCNGRLKKAGQHFHVAVQNVYELPVGDLIAQLGADTAAAFVRISQLGNRDGIAPGDVDGVVG